jgi:aryl-alcohol dehydrogenase-like predicted oxidoreductase
VESLVDPTIVVMDERTKEYHTHTNMAAVPFSSQAGGFFSGRYLKNEPTVGGKVMGILRDYGNDVNFARMERTQEVASSLHTTSAVVSLAYLFSHPFPVFPIIGSRTPEQLIDSCRAGELRLDPSVARFIESGQSGEE